MKHIIAAIALLAATVPALAEPAIPSHLDPRTMEYRMWSAEQEIKHLVVRLGRMTAACNDSRVQTFFPKVSEECEKNVMSLYPQLKTIREIAASGDEYQWAIVMDIIRTLEKDTEAPLQTVERK